MTHEDGPDESCNVFNILTQPLDRNVVHQFIVGEDSAPRRMSSEEASRELGDPFAALLLLNGIFPRTADEVLAKLDEATEDDDSLRKQMSFILGEGGRIPISPETAELPRNLRFLVTRGDGRDGPDVILSAFFPDKGVIELMAWDPRAGGFI